MQRDEEAELVRGVADGDREAFRRLVLAHQGPLGAYAQRMLGDRTAAEDVVQETLLRLWSRAGSFRPEASRLTTWLHNIAHNLCIDGFRRGGRIVYGDTPDPGALEGGGADEPADAEARREEAARIRSALAELPERQRSALLLCHYQGLSNRDAAEILAVSVEALESLLARARRSLKKTLGDDRAA